MTKKNDTYKKHELVKVPTSELKMGMHVAELDRPWLGTPFMLQGFPLEKQEDLNTLRNICEFVYIDTLKSHYLDRTQRVNLAAPGMETVQYQTLAPVEREITQAEPVYQESLTEIQSLLHSAQEKCALQTTIVKNHIRSCVDSIERNPSAMIWLTRIKNVDQYTAEHCLNVGVLAIALGRHLGLTRQQLELLGLCGMLHDVGKMQLDQAVLNKEGSLTPQEYLHVKQHTTFGMDILKQDVSLPQEVGMAAFSHHERMDGRGYPKRLKENQIGFYTRVVSIVDAYDAMTSRRCYSAPKSSAEALKILYDYSDAQFDRQLVVKFIECIGLYPPGCVVEMVSGEVGVVLSVDSENRLLPKVALLLDRDKRLMQQRIVDLKLERNSPDGAQHHIKSVLTDGSYGIDLAQFTRTNIHTAQAGKLS